MPNRIIKDSICASEKINSLSDFQFRLWVGLITYVDDYGRGDARPAMIKGGVFPLLERVGAKDIQSALLALAETGCIGLYEVEGRPYLFFPNWERHQRIQTKRPRYPGPEAADGKSPSSTVAHGEIPPESNPNPNTESNTSYHARVKAFVPPTADEVAAYCRERNNGVDPQRFVDYYASRGWMLGKSAMRDWQAAVRIWESKTEKKPGTGAVNPADIDLADLEEIRRKVGGHEGSCERAQRRRGGQPGADAGTGDEGLAV